MSEITPKDVVAQMLRRSRDTDPELLAGEILHVLHGHGYRQTSARTEEWQRTHGEPADPERVHGHAEAARRELVAALEAERMRPTPRRPGGRGEP